MDKAPNQFGMKLVVSDPTGLPLSVDGNDAWEVGRSVAEYAIALGVFKREDVEALQIGSFIRAQDHTKLWCVLVVHYSIPMHLLMTVVAASSNHQHYHIGHVFVIEVCLDWCVGESQVPMIVAIPTPY